MSFAVYKRVLAFSLEHLEYKALFSEENKNGENIIALVNYGGGSIMRFASCIRDASGFLAAAFLC